MIRARTRPGAWRAGGLSYPSLPFREENLACGTIGSFALGSSSRTTGIEYVRDPFSVK